MITVRYYAAARELAGCPEERLELVESTAGVPRLREQLAERHARLEGYLHRMRFAINGELVGDDARVRDGDEVDVLPPVAGGAPAPLVALRDAPLSVDECMRSVSEPTAGGVAVFTGVVRNHADGRAVARLDYEAHPELAVREMRRIVEGLEREIPGVRVAAVHRVGTLEVGDLAVVVAASAAHRAEAFDACRAAVDRIKASVPIWKKEWAADGDAHWVNLEDDPP